MRVHARSYKCFAPGSYTLLLMTFKGIAGSICPRGFCLARPRFTGPIVKCVCLLRVMYGRMNITQPMLIHQATWTPTCDAPKRLLRKLAIGMNGSAASL